MFDHGRRHRVGGISRYRYSDIDSCRERRRNLRRNFLRRNLSPFGARRPIGDHHLYNGRARFRYFNYGRDGFRDHNQNGDGRMVGVEITPDDDARQGNNHTDVIAKPDPTVLLVTSVDLCIDKNSKVHHTDRYEISEEGEKDRKLVVRRGRSFDIKVKFSKPYDAKSDDLRLVFEIGDTPSSNKGTYVDFILSDEDKPKQWGAKILSQKDTQVLVQIFTPPDLFVGKWDFSIEVVKADDTSVDIYQYEHDDPIYVIFNPWCKDDTTYLEQNELLQEYIMNESGRLYCGSQSQISSRPWNYGQFESCVLDVAIYLLDESDLKLTSRGNPISVVRKISAMVNSSDDNGVLTGNWSGDYKGGRSPLSWTGSVAILEEYWKNKVPVKFGQCWVFSGVCTSVCRALGIPSRSVTNFASAHDTDGTVTIDTHLDCNGKRDDSKCDDSVWNFHVWNEAWMVRPDLPTGYGGWQAFDATPQETSDGVFCCGPVSVEAIKNGELMFPHDGPFVFAEVNADRMCWMADVRGKLMCVGCQKSAVGKFISTKAPNSNDRLDVTGEYKHKEGSAAERAAVMKANQTGSTRHDIYKQEEKDVKFTIKQDSSRNKMGEEFDAQLVYRNTSNERRTISGRLTVSTMYYTGIVGADLKEVKFQDIVVDGGQEGCQDIVVKAKEYDGKLLDGAMLDLSVFVIVHETNQVFVTKEDFALTKPPLTIKAPREVMKGEEFKVEVTFTNPLDTPLTNCFIVVDGLAQELKFPQSNVNAKGTYMTTLHITPKKKGQKELILNFNSLQMEDVNGSIPIFVKDNF